jgi:predicted PolB exonuclease-like 3'-5' exonuclease
VTPVLAFDIETVPDITGLRKLNDYAAQLADRDIAELAFQRRRAQTGNDFMQLHLQRVVAISCVLREGSTFKVWSLGAVEDGEAVLVQRFFDGIDKFTPQLVSWNGGGFDLPVLHYRGLVHGITAARYWDWGDDDREFKWNNYLSRYHTRHLDLMDVLAMYQPRNNAPLDDVAKLAGFPGKLGMDGSKVWDAFQAGRIVEIRNYCETDVVNTYLLYLRFQLMRGALDRANYDREVKLARDTLGKMPDPHWREYLAAWAA